MGIYGTEIVRTGVCSSVDGKYMGQRVLEKAFVHQLMGIYGTESVRKGVCSSAGTRRPVRSSPDSVQPGSL